MALSDIFGSGSQFKGLLSDEDIGGAKNDALLNASLALLSAGGPSTQKIGIGQALAQAYGSGRRAFQGGIENGIDAQSLRAKMEEQKRAQMKQQVLQDAAVQARDANGNFDPKAYFSMAAPYLADPIASYAQTADARVKGGEADRVERQAAGMVENPFTALADTVHPKVKNLALQYAKAFPNLRPDDVEKRYQTIVELSNKEADREQSAADRRDAAADRRAAMAFNQNMAGANLEIARGNQDMRRAQMMQAKAPTEMQSNAQGFADRMLQSTSILDKTTAPGTMAQTLGAIPGVGNLARNKWMSPEEQKYNQAAQDWIRAKLRKESGAAIGVEEAASEYRTYFPQVGDSPEVIKQKADARKVATEAMVRSGGPSYSPNVGTPASQPMNALPPATGTNKGRRVRDTITGKIYESNGTQWKEAQ